MPKLNGYWKSEYKYSNMADYMGRDRFHKLGRFLHFVDNNFNFDI